METAIVTAERAIGHRWATAQVAHPAPVVVGPDRIREVLHRMFSQAILRLLRC